MKDLNKILKIFPFMPDKGSVKDLILTIAFYFFAPVVAGCILLPVVVIIFPLLLIAPIIDLALTVYGILGIIFSIMNYMGKDVDLNKIFKTEQK